MKFKYKYMLSAISIFSGLALTGCSSKPLTETEVNEFSSYVYSQSTNNELDFYEFQEQIHKYISRIEDKDVTSQIINDYIYVIYNEVSKYTSFFNIIGDDLEIIKEKLNIDKLDVSMHEKISKESKVIGAILEEMEDKDIFLIDKNNLYTIEVDMNKILEKFKQYISSDLIDFMNFRADEISNLVYDANTDNYDVDLLLKRVSIAMDNIKNNSDSSQLTNWQSTADYYYQIILSEYTNQFLDTSDIEIKKIKKEYLDELKSKLDNYKSSLIYNPISKYIELLEKNDYNMDSEEVTNYRNEILNDIFEQKETTTKDVSSTESTTQETSNSETGSDTEN